jgi:hypothetical protein
MNIFLSWSGEQSKAIAETLRSWLPQVIQSLKPWMSKEDISKGATWDREITEKLKTCPIGIICLTPDNLTAPWLLFEAGAISNNVEIEKSKSGQVVVVGKTQVCTYLHDLKPTQLKEPLSKFQATVANKEDTKRLLQTINQSLKDNRLIEKQLDEAFEIWWPRLEQLLLSVRKPVTPAPEVTERELLEQILTGIRNLERNGEQRITSFGKYIYSPSIVSDSLLQSGVVFEPGTLAWDSEPSPSIIISQPINFEPSETVLTVEDPLKPSKPGKTSKITEK